MLSVLLFLLLIPSVTCAWTLTDRCELTRDTPEGSYAVSATANGVLLRLPDGLVADGTWVKVEFGNRRWRVRTVGGAVELEGAVEPLRKGNWLVLHSGGDEPAGLSLAGSSAAWARLLDCDLPPRQGWLALSGQIDASAGDRIIAAIRDRRPEGLVLDSAGGSSEEAQRIGTRVRESGLATKVESGMQCLSECVFILAAGAPRTVELGARVGFPPSLIIEGLGVFDAYPGRREDSALYLTEMGVDGGKLAVLTIALTGDDMRLLTPAELQSVGLVDATAPVLAENPLFTRQAGPSEVGWWWLLLGVLGFGVILRAATMRWMGG